MMHYIERSILARMTMELQKWKKNTGNLILVHFEDFIFALNFNFMFSFFLHLIWLFGDSCILCIRLILSNVLISGFW